MREGEIAYDEIVRLSAEITNLRCWVDDLQSGMFVNCVYCGHRYGPRETTPATIPEGGGLPSMAEALTAHIERCPKHPLAAARAEIAVLTVALAQRTGWQRCPIHGAINADHQWGCPDCVAALRTALRRLAVRYHNSVHGAPDFAVCAEPICVEQHAVLALPPVPGEGGFA